MAGDPVNAPARPSRVVAIASVPRSGSWLLAEALDATGLAGHPQESLGSPALVDHHRDGGVLRLTARGHLGRVRRRLRGDPHWAQTSRFTRRSLEHYLARITPDATTPNGVLGIKVHWTQYEWAMLRHGLDVGWWDAPVSWILLTRADHVRQACSLVRARQTGWWDARRQRIPREPDARYDAELIADAITEIRVGEAAWDAHFRTVRAEPYRLRYEDLVADYPGTVRGVLDHLGLDAPVAPPRLVRQADDLTEEWVRRFANEQGDGAPAATSPRPRSGRSRRRR